MISNITFVVATVKEARVRNKNIKKFGKTNLLEIKLRQIRRVFRKSKIFKF